MKIQGVFEAALLKYIQKHVDQRAEGIRNWHEEHTCCYGHSDDDSCCCDTSIRVRVDYRVPLPPNVNRLGYPWEHFGYTWEYNGDFSELINMLDRMENEDE